MRGWMEGRCAEGEGRRDLHLGMLGMRAVQQPKSSLSPRKEEQGGNTLYAWWGVSRFTVVRMGNDTIINKE